MIAKAQHFSIVYTRISVALIHETLWFRIHVPLGINPDRNENQWKTLFLFFPWLTEVVGWVENNRINSSIDCSWPAIELFRTDGRWWRRRRRGGRGRQKYFSVSILDPCQRTERVPDRRAGGVRFPCMQASILASETNRVGHCALALLCGAFGCYSNPAGGAARCINSRSAGSDLTDWLPVTRESHELDELGGGTRG